MYTYTNGKRSRSKSKKNVEYWQANGELLKCPYMHVCISRTILAKTRCPQVQSIQRCYSQTAIHFHLPQVCLCCASDRDHHGDIEEGEEQDGKKEEDKERDLMDWVPLKAHKVCEKNVQVEK